MANVIVSTLETVPGRQITVCGDVVTASFISPQFMANGGRVVSTFSAVFHGGKDKAYGSLLGDYTKNVIQDLVNQAESKGFNALLGLRFSHTYVQTNDALIIVAYATPCSVR